MNPHSCNCIGCCEKCGSCRTWPGHTPEYCELLQGQKEERKEFLEAALNPPGVPPMPEGFPDRAAWDAIHWKFSGNNSLLDQAVMGWQRDNQLRCQEAARAAAEAREKSVTTAYDSIDDLGDDKPVPDLKSGWE